MIFQPGLMFVCKARSPPERCITWVSSGLTQDFQPNLMFVSKTGAYPKGVPVFLANTRLGIIKIFSQNSVFPFFFFFCFSFAKNTFILLFLSAVTDTVICGDRPKKTFFFLTDGQTR